MTTINDIKDAVDLICQDVLKMANSVMANETLTTQICYEVDNLSDYLTPFELLKLSEKISLKYKIDGMQFLNLKVLSFPIRYLACYILLHGGELKLKIKKDKNDNKNS